jgi:hypothetical protein
MGRTDALLCPHMPGDKLSIADRCLNAPCQKRDFHR